MVSKVFEGTDVEIPAVLANRDRRVATQAQLLREHPSQVVVACKLNIPGPVKNSAAIQAFFTAGLARLEDQWLACGQPFEIATSWEDAPTGPERFYLLYSAGVTVKEGTVHFEERQPANRLFDLDVLITNGGESHSLSRGDFDLPVRTCLICGRPAKECGRSRRHSVEELQARVAKLIDEATAANQRETVTEQLADQAVKAMLNEVVTWPKPGLVDPVEHRAHPDMDAFTFIQSATSLRPYFKQATTAGLNFPTGQPAPLFFNQLRLLGQRAETTMFKATAGVNTHKGTIFSLGILTGTVATLKGRQLPVTQLNVQRVVKEMLANLLATDLDGLKHSQQLTAGERQYLAYGQTGIRGEAASGFPTVFKYGLPTWRANWGMNQNDRQLTTFLKIARHTDDTTLVKRAGDPAILVWKDQQLDRFFELGGLTTKQGRQFLVNLEKDFSDRHLSLGGAADLLIATIFLASVMEGDNDHGTKD